ncbi:MAG: glycosyltransferase family 39 protein [Ignavibacteriales bacterium]|nr:glycosyltransferase family 39 protein [Ignavibacteriales bacterium]
MKSKTLNIYLPLLFLFFIVLSTIILRMRLLDVPLERDEGEYAYIGQLILDGTPPYSEAYNMKFPGIYFFYAGILWLFGETHTAIHFCLLIVNVLSIILLYIFARTAYDDWVAAAAAGAFALLSMSYHVQGFWANAEHFILPFIIGANLLLLVGLRKNRIDYILFGALLFGCAALVKQHGAFFGLLGFAALLISLWQNKALDKNQYWKYLVVYFSGVIIPLLLCFFYLAYAGVFHNFYLWTFAYAKEYTSLVPTTYITYYFFSSFLPLWQHTTLIWIIAGIGLIALFIYVPDKQSYLIVMGMIIASIIALSVGFYFRPHYFILILPAVALLFGIGVRFIFRVFSPASSFIIRYFPPIFIVTIAILGTLAAHWDVLVQFSPAQVTTTRYGQNPFLYSSMIGELIKEKTSKDDRIAIIGSEPQFLFYSQRRSVTSFIYTYALVEDQPFAEQFRSEMIRQVESATPKLLIFPQVIPEWYTISNGEKEINRWFYNFAKLHYTQVARFEYSSSEDTILVTDPTLITKKPTHLFWISIYELQKD